MGDTSYLSSDVFHKINHRLRPAPSRIDLRNHIKRVIKLFPDTGGGITFEPQDHRALLNAITDTKAFAKDDRGNFFGALASAATSGLGIRQIGLTSLHWQKMPGVRNLFPVVQPRKPGHSGFLLGKLHVRVFSPGRLCQGAIQSSSVNPGMLA